MTKRINIGKVAIGAGASVAIQSMTNTDTKDYEATLMQIDSLKKAGCEIVRVAAYDEAAARAIKYIKQGTDLPIVADVHFDYKIAIAAIEAGADKVRINPGNIGQERRIAMVADAAKSAGIPIRVGANSGSVRSDLKGMQKADALVQGALENIALLEKCGFYDIVVSVKASDVRTCIAAYEKMSKTDYPLHLGVTEAGAFSSSIVKSSMGIGALLAKGIGDTIRVSVTGDPVKEIDIAKDILRFLGLRKFGAEIISCPTCARTQIDIEEYVSKIEQLNIQKPIKIAVMGCAVNGPGEAMDADVGIAGGKDCAMIFMSGKTVKKVSADEVLSELLSVIDEL